jgi:hypothetical protein
MPNIATHGLLAQDVLDNAPFTRLAQLIERYPKAYFLGSNGPDLLFYYHSLPWQSKAGADRFNRMGNLVHSQKIDEFYRKAVEIIQAIPHGETRQIMTVYLAGHLTHWSLDTVAHPYVFYKTGAIQGATKYWHFRLESMIDTLMVKQTKGYLLSKFDMPSLVKVDETTKEAVAQLYRPILSDVFGEEASEEELKECVTSIHTLASYLYDPYTIKFPLVQFGESLLGVKWKFSGHIVTGKMDLKRDVLNLNHATWKHPCDATKVSDESFIDLYQSAIRRATGVLCALNDVLFKENIVDQLIGLLDDRTYDTGMKNPPEMQHYDPIY